MVVGFSSRIRLNLYRLKQMSFLMPLSGKAELRLEKYNLLYGENMQMNVRENIVDYHLRVLRRESMDTKSMHSIHVCVRTSVRPLPAPGVTYDMVGIVPFRSLYNLFHFPETVNTIVHFILHYEKQFPVPLLYLS